MTTDPGPQHRPDAASLGFSAVLGALAGAAVTGNHGRALRVGGAALGAVGLAAIDSVARTRQKPGEIPALWSRIAASGAIAATLGWTASRVDGSRTARGRHWSRFRCRGHRATPAEGRPRPSGRRRRGAGASSSAYARGRCRGGRRSGGGVPDAVGVRCSATSRSACLPRRCPPPRSRSSSRSRPGRGTSALDMCATSPRSLAAPTPRARLTSASSSRSTHSAGPDFDPATYIRMCASSMSTPRDSPSTSCRSGGCGSARDTCSIAPSSPGRSGRRTSR